MQVDVEPLTRFQEAWKPNEPNRLSPVHVERVSLRDAVAARKGLSLESIFGNIELIEPTFQVRSDLADQRRVDILLQSYLYYISYKFNFRHL